MLLEGTGWAEVAVAAMRKVPPPLSVCVFMCKQVKVAQSISFDKSTT